MQKINYLLSGRLAAIKTRAEKNARHDPAGAYKSALEYQVKYGRKGWIKYDSANHYDDAGNMRRYDLNGFDVTPIQEISPRVFDYLGYYADNFQMELIKPYIVKIKTSRGLFIAPAVAYSDCDISTIYLSRGQLAPNDPQDLAHQAAIYDTARIADHIAEREADKSREADAQFQAEQEAEQLAEEISEARKMARGLIAAIRAQRKAGIDLGGAICDALTDKLREYRRDVIKARERREALALNYWLAVD